MFKISGQDSSSVRIEAWTMALVIGLAVSPTYAAKHKAQTQSTTTTTTTSTQTVTTAPAPISTGGLDVGPRDAVGPDVPLSATDPAALAPQVVVQGTTAAAVQAACNSAAASGTPVVYLPAGRYVFETTVRVPGGLTLLGAGSTTLCRTQNSSIYLFCVAGDRVRFTHLKLQGADITPRTTNHTIGITVTGKQNVHVDHCELLGFLEGTVFNAEATAQIDHCSIHHCMTDGYGYGVCVLSGSYVLVTDNDFSQCRHCLASNGALDWSSGATLGIYVHIPGVRTPHWDFRHNHVHGDDLTTNRLATVDAHPGMDGSFTIQNNLFEDIRIATDLRDGCGLIDHNLFGNLWGTGTVAISIRYGTQNGIPVENAMPHDIYVAENSFSNVPQLYSIGTAENITIDGVLVPSTYDPTALPPAPIPYLQEMGQDGVLTWTYL
jgi:hypothetical protein